jgi:hypothetical protein
MELSKDVACMKYIDKYLSLREELWTEFEKMVRTGASFHGSTDTCIKGYNPVELPKTTEGDSWFLAKEIIADPDYVLHLGEDIIVGTGEVDFRDTEGTVYRIEPDILDLLWLADLLDDRR